MNNSLSAPLKQRLRDLEDNITQHLALLKDVEEALLYEDNPRSRAKYKREIGDLRNATQQYQQEYVQIRAEINGREPEELETVANQLQEMNTRLQALQIGQTAVKEDILSMRRTIVARYAVGEQTIISNITNRLAESQLMTVKILIDAVQANRISAADMHQLLKATEQTLIDAGQREEILPNQKEIASVLNTPTLDAKARFKLIIPIVPFLLQYETELGLSSGLNLKAVWQRVIHKISTT